MEREKSLGWLCRMIVEKDIAKVVAGHCVMLWYDSLSLSTRFSQVSSKMGVGGWGRRTSALSPRERNSPSMIGLGSPISPQQLSKQIQSLQPIKNRLSATLHTTKTFAQTGCLPYARPASGLRYGTDVRYLPSLTQG